MTLYAYSPDTGELINAATIADWMGTTTIKPPAFDSATAGCFWRGNRWVIEAATDSRDMPQVIAARRYEAEIGGITLNGIEVATDDRSKLLINGAALEAVIDPDYTMQWKTGDGFVSLTGAQVIGIARAVRAHVQACFDRECALVAELEAGTLTDAMLEQGWP